MFIDASAIVSILKGEPPAAGLLAALDAAKGKTFSSPIARFEAIMLLSAQASKTRGEEATSQKIMGEVEGLVDGLLTEVGARDITISSSIGRAACEAAARYGEGAGHPAQLTMAGCFAYVCAKAYHTQLLYAGGGFALTDIG